MSTQQIEQQLLTYIRDNNGVKNYFGHFKFSVADRIGQGGNGLVYSALLGEKAVAIKFLIADWENKFLRFKSEFFNTNFVKENLIDVVNMIHYDQLKLDGQIEIPYIIMTKYETSLKNYRNTITNVNIDQFKALAKFLFQSVKSLHDNGILHRDIKPENILIDSKGKYYLSDLGIAHFDNAEFPIDNKTKKSERLANIEFSAPEQINNFFPVTQASDIYSIAQVLYWFVFKTVNRGTGGQYISSVIEDEDSYIYDNIIYKCINNDPLQRFQSINDIESYYIHKKYEEKDEDPFDDMYKFSRAIRSVVPEFYKRVHYIEDKDEMEKLFRSIFSQKYNRSIEFNSGKGNNTINSIIKLENNGFLMDCRQINIARIWGLLTDDIYDDILLLELEKSQPYIINGSEHYYVAKINDEDIVPINSIESGFIRYKGEVVDIHDLNIQERNANYDYKVIAIAPFHNCAIIEENDKYIVEFQSKSKITADDIMILKRNIHKNKTRDIMFRL